MALSRHRPAGAARAGNLHKLQSLEPGRYFLQARALQGFCSVLGSAMKRSSEGRDVTTVGGCACPMRNSICA